MIWSYAHNLISPSSSNPFPSSSCRIEIALKFGSAAADSNAKKHEFIGNVKIQKVFIHWQFCHSLLGEIAVSECDKKIKKRQKCVLFKFPGLVTRKPSWIERLRLQKKRRKEQKQTLQWIFFRERRHLISPAKFHLLRSKVKGQGQGHHRRRRFRLLSPVVSILGTFFGKKSCSSSSTNLSHFERAAWVRTATS